MPLITPPLTKDDFINARAQDVINSSASKECLIYNQAFWKKAQEAKEAGNIREQAVFALLVTVTGAALKPESTEEFFVGIFQNLTDEQLDFLTEIAFEITDPELQARVADILWARQYNYRMAQLAVTAYLQAAIELEKAKRWSQSFERIERALRLARKIRYQAEKVVEQIEAILDRYDEEDPGWLPAKLMALLQEYQLGNPPKYTALAQKAATLAESVHDWRRARAYWEIKAKWHFLNEDGEKAGAGAALLAAETYVKEAEEAFKKTPNNLVVSHCLQKAVIAFRNIQGSQAETAEAKARAEEVSKRLRQSQQESCNELITVSQIDINQEVEQARACVRGKEFQDALFALALLVTPTKVSYLRQEIQQMTHDYVASNLFPPDLIDKVGQVVFQQPGSILANTLDEAETATRSELYRGAIYYQTLQAQALIEPARHQINLEHNVRIKDFLPIVSHSVFVPPEREYLFAKGLYAGLTGDFLASTHILIPQIENSIRYLLWQEGAIASELDPREVQNEYSLTATLYRSEIASIFDEDTLFDLQGLLVEHSGSNLRNRMAHGLINDEGFLSPLLSYLWWIALRHCCLPIMIHQQETE